MVSREDIEGFEHDGLARDAVGHVALLTTAGGGFVPGEYLEHMAGYEVAMDAVSSLPPTTSPRFAPQLDPQHVNTWAIFAERGFFAYDSDAHGGPYRLVAAPNRPVDLQSLPVPVATLVSRVRLAVVFGQSAVTLELP